MKTIEQVKKDIDILMKVGKSTHDETEKNRCRRQLKLIRPMLTYLERVTPTEKNLTDQLNKALKDIERIEREFDAMYSGYHDSKTKSAFMKSKGMPDLKRQVKSLQYLLESK